MFEPIMVAQLFGRFVSSSFFFGRFVTDQSSYRDLFPLHDLVGLRVVQMLSQVFTWVEMWRVLKISSLSFLGVVSSYQGGKGFLIGRLSQARAFSGWNGGRGWAMGEVDRSCACGVELLKRERKPCKHVLHLVCVFLRGGLSR